MCLWFVHFSIHILYFKGLKYLTLEKSLTLTGTVPGAVWRWLLPDLMARMHEDWPCFRQPEACSGQHYFFHEASTKPGQGGMWKKACEWRVSFALTSIVDCFISHAKTNRVHSGPWLPVSSRTGNFARCWTNTVACLLVLPEKLVPEPKLGRRPGKWGALKSKFAAPQPHCWYEWAR